MQIMLHVFNKFENNIIRSNDDNAFIFSLRPCSDIILYLYIAV